MWGKPAGNLMGANPTSNSKVHYSSDNISRQRQNGQQKEVSASRCSPGVKSEPFK
jgi:hypothetical protein